MRANVTRYAIAVAIAFLLLLGLLLLVRPMIYSVAPPRDDSVYAVATAASVPTSEPLVKELLLNTPHVVPAVGPAPGVRPSSTDASDPC